jgi:hypothetical protein
MYSDPHSAGIKQFGLRGLNSFRRMGGWGRNNENDAVKPCLNDEVEGLRLGESNQLVLDKPLQPTMG